MADKAKAGIQDVNRQTNRDFAEKNGTFIAACGEAGVEPTKRQAAKYRKGRGAARSV